MKLKYYLITFLLIIAYIFGSTRTNNHKFKAYITYDPLLSFELPLNYRPIKYISLDLGPSVEFKKINNTFDNKTFWDSLFGGKFSITLGYPINSENGVLYPRIGPSICMQQFLGIGYGLKFSLDNENFNNHITWGCGVNYHYHPKVLDYLSDYFSKRYDQDVTIRKEDIENFKKTQNNFDVFFFIGFVL